MVSSVVRNDVGRDNTSWAMKRSTRILVFRKVLSSGFIDNVLMIQST